MTPRMQSTATNHHLRQGRCRSLDGRTVALEGVNLDFSLPWTATIAFSQKGQELGFVEGLAGIAEDLQVVYPALTYSGSSRESVRGFG